MDNAPLVLWVLSSGVGLTVSVFGGWSALRDLASLGTIRNGRRLVVLQRLFAQFARGTTMAAWLAVALVPSVTDHIAGVLVATNGLITAVAISDYFVGVALRRSRPKPPPSS